MADIRVWFNPRCSKARQTRDLLAERGVEFELVEYLTDTPSRAEIEATLRKLGAADPRALIRSKEAVYAELGLAAADREALLDAMVAHPILIERPVVIRGERAVVARPPERALELL